MGLMLMIPVTKQVENKITFKFVLDFDLMISKYNFTSDIINNFKIVTFAESEEF